jgi:hypothetical protein
VDGSLSNNLASTPRLGQDDGLLLEADQRRPEKTSTGTACAGWMLEYTQKHKPTYKHTRSTENRQPQTHPTNTLHQINIKTWTPSTHTHQGPKTTWRQKAAHMRQRVAVDHLRALEEDVDEPKDQPASWRTN